MSYRDFTLKQVQANFGLTIVEGMGLFSGIEEVQISDYFALTLNENIPLAISINTEKARSELLVSNVLVELRKNFDRKISFFSGIEFTVDKEKGLNGYCDFVVSLSPEQLFLQSPAIVLVEAKNENLIGGLGQCIAEMIAARLFNEQNNTQASVLYGCVTTGVAWKFARLRGTILAIDLKDYNLDDAPKKVMGILSSMIRQIA